MKNMWLTGVVALSEDQLYGIYVMLPLLVFLAWLAIDTIVKARRGR